MEFISRLHVRGILLITIIFFLVLTYNTFAKSAPPSLDEVLKRPDSSLDWSTVVFGFFALSLSTLTLAKAYEIFKKSPEFKERTRSAFDDTEIKSLKGNISELNSLLKSKTKESEDLRSKLQGIIESAGERAESEELLKRSLTILRKNNEKLMAEKEKLSVELNRGNSPELFKKQRAAQKKAPAKKRAGLRKRVK